MPFSGKKKIFRDLQKGNVKGPLCVRKRKTTVSKIFRDPEFVSNSKNHAKATKSKALYMVQSKKGWGHKVGCVDTGGIFM